MPSRAAAAAETIVGVLRPSLLLRARNRVCLSVGADFRCSEPNRPIRTEVVKKIAAVTKTTTAAAAEMNGRFLRRLFDGA